MKTIETILWIVLIFVVVDMLGFLMWGMSGQRPVDGFYVGSVTYHIVQDVRR